LPTGAGREIIADIDNGLPVEEERFPELIVDSTVSLDDIRRKSYGWLVSLGRSGAGTGPRRWLGLSPVRLKL
jgi:hypothetical protein